MDFLSELEAMADTVSFDGEVVASNIERWQRLFKYTPDEARRKIEAYRGDFTKRLVSNEHWDLVRHTKEAHGFDIEAYSYSLDIKQESRPKESKRAVNVNTTYILKLGGPISTPEDIQKIAHLTHPPIKSTGTGETGSTSFCTISSSTRDQVLEYLHLNHPTHTPTIIKLSKSRKELSPISLAPFLGLDITLPHHRPDTNDFVPLPRQTEYPVYYFFYGRLLEPELLTRQLNLSDEPVYRPARVHGGKMRSWRDKYKALVDGEETDFVDGAVFLVENEECEDSLRFFETDAYEVVRCWIWMGGGKRENVAGLVFRFCGVEGELI